MKFKFERHTFYVHDRIASLMTKLIGHASIGVELGDNNGFIVKTESHNFITNGNDHDSEINTIEIFGTRTSAAQDHDTSDTGVSDLQPRCTLYNRDTQTYIDIFGESALSIMGVPQGHKLKIDGKEYIISFNYLWISAVGCPRFNPLRMHGTIDLA